MGIKLEDCTEITSLQYSELPSPKFEGQTRVGEDGIYWMVFSQDGINYKIQGRL